MDMIVEIEVTQLLSWKFARNVTDLRLVDVTHLIYCRSMKEQLTNLQ